MKKQITADEIKEMLNQNFEKELHKCIDNFKREYDAGFIDDVFASVKNFARYNAYLYTDMASVVNHLCIYTADNDLENLIATNYNYKQAFIKNDLLNEICDDYYWSSKDGIHCIKDFLLYKIHVEMREYYPNLENPVYIDVPD